MERGELSVQKKSRSCANGTLFHTPQAVTCAVDTCLQNDPRSPWETRIVMRNAQASFLASLDQRGLHDLRVYLSYAHSKRSPSPRFRNSLLLQSVSKRL